MDTCVGADNFGIVQHHVQADNLSVTFAKRNLKLIDQFLMLPLQAVVEWVDNLLGVLHAGRRWILF